MKEFGALKQRDGLLSQADMLTFSHTGIPGAENIKAFGALRKSQPIPKPQPKETAAAAMVASEATAKNNKEEKDSRVENTRTPFSTIDGAQSDDDDDDGAVSQEVLLAVALQKSKRRQSGTGASTTARPTTGSFAEKLLGRALISPHRDTKIRNNDNKNAILSGSHHVPSLNARNLNNLALSSSSEHSPRNSSHQQKQHQPESPSLVKRFSGMFSSSTATTTVEPAASTANASWNTNATNPSNHSMSGGSSSQHRPPMSPNPNSGRASYNKTASLRSVLAASRGGGGTINTPVTNQANNTTGYGLTGSMRSLFSSSSKNKTMDGSGHAKNAALSLLGGSLHSHHQTSPSPCSLNIKPKVFGNNSKTAINLASYHASEHSDDESDAPRRTKSTARYNHTVQPDDDDDDDTDNHSFCEEVLSPLDSRRSDNDYQRGISMVLEASQETTLHKGSSSAISMQMSSSLSGDVESLGSPLNSIKSKRNNGDSTSSQQSSFVISMGQLPFGGEEEEEEEEENLAE